MADHRSGDSGLPCGNLSTAPAKPLHRHVNCDIFPPMDGDRTEQAVKRIEAALARIAAAAEAAPAAQPAMPANVSSLVVKHEALRDQVSGAFGELDRLIAEIEK